LRGAAVGAVLTPAMTVTNMTMDLTAPVSYPVVCAISTYTMLFKGDYKLLGAFVGILGGAIAVPVAPVNFITRPLWQPLFNVALGAALGAILCGALD